MNEHALKVIDPSYLGIFWFTPPKRLKDLRFFQTINYLLDDLIQKNPREDGPDNSSLFLGNNFGAEFFVGHFPTTDPFPYDRVDRHYEVIKSFSNEDRRNVLVLGEDDTLGQKEFERLQRRYNNLTLHWLKV